MAVKRVPTGIKGFDDLIEGGLPANSATLLSGSPGTGKTLFCLEYLVTGAKNGETGMIISFEQQAADILSQALEFNWEFQKLVDEGKIIVKYVDILEDENLFEDIREMVKKNQVKRLVIDSLTAMQNYPAMLRHAEKLQVVITRNDKVRWTIHEQSLRRMIVHYFVEALKELEGTTTILISDTKDENSALSSDGISEFLCDAVIVLYYTGISGDDARNLQIRKIRWTKQKKGFFQYEFSPNGIEISNEGSGVMMK